MNFNGFAGTRLMSAALDGLNRSINQTANYLRDNVLLEMIDPHWDSPVWDYRLFKEQLVSAFIVLDFMDSHIPTIRRDFYNAVCDVGFVSLKPVATLATMTRYLVVAHQLKAYMETWKALIDAGKDVDDFDAIILIECRKHLIQGVKKCRELKAMDILDAKHYCQALLEGDRQ